MEDLEILSLWKAYDQKLNQSLRLNRENAIEITRMKAQSLLSSMKPLKLFTLVIGIAWVIFIDWLIISLFDRASLAFLISAGVLSLLNTLAIFIYVYQLVLIEQVSINEPLLRTQERIARLKSSTLWVARLLFLQLPFWTSFYWNKSMLINGNGFLWIFQGVITLLFSLAALWLFLNIRFKNRNKKWFKLIFRGREWQPVMAAMDLLNQIEEYDKV